MQTLVQYFVVVAIFEDPTVVNVIKGESVSLNCWRWKLHLGTSGQNRGRKCEKKGASFLLVFYKCITSTFFYFQEFTSICKNKPKAVDVFVEG